MEKDNNTKFEFLWKTEGRFLWKFFARSQEELSWYPPELILNMKGYLTTDLPISFLNEANLYNPDYLPHNKRRVFSILTTSCAKDKNFKDNNYWILQKTGPKGDASNSAATFQQIWVLKGKEDWDLQNTRALITNEAAMALRRLIVNTSNKVNPLKHWNYAIWLY